MAFGAGIPRDRIEILDDAGHSPMISRPREVAGFIQRAAGDGVGIGGREMDLEWRQMTGKVQLDKIEG
ncbi:hypothetical protein ACJ72_06961 [Emergomyces africanus]|uniref:Uncharacterized protein n=1 Tax=Emergomyces africanus TaxID=1955775 RepID=A0A1B7NPL3_9EURO|nr:hypothetical protein ACJ72_06961 [Emergomyces africanus]